MFYFKGSMTRNDTRFGRSGNEARRNPYHETKWDTSITAAKGCSFTTLLRLPHSAMFGLLCKTIAFTLFMIKSAMSCLRIAKAEL
jgi:hypothetical protein